MNWYEFSSNQACLLGTSIGGSTGSLWGLPGGSSIVSVDTVLDDECHKRSRNDEHFAINPISLESKSGFPIVGPISRVRSILSPSAFLMFRAFLQCSSAESYVEMLTVPGKCIGVNDARIARYEEILPVIHGLAVAVVNVPPLRIHLSATSFGAWYTTGKPRGWSTRNMEIGKTAIVGIVLCVFDEDPLREASLLEIYSYSRCVCVSLSEGARKDRLSQRVT